MKLIDKILGYTNLAFTFIAFAMTIFTLTQPTVNWYKSLFWFMVMVLNMLAYLSYLAHRD